MANGDDITWRNETMPHWPEGLPLWTKIMCLFGYHLWETRQSAPGHCYGMQTEEGERKGVFGLHDETPMKLRDQCGRCGTLR
jgi:hypothetical protein